MQDPQVIQKFNDEPEQQQQKKQIGKKIAESFQKVFRLKKSANDINEKQQSQQPLIMLEQVQQPPILDLLNFEYLYSSLKQISEDSVKKCIECIKIMTHDPIDQKKLANVLYLGVDDEMKPLRAITWRILIGYLPPSRKLWINILEKNSLNYKQLIEENILSKLRKSQQLKDSKNNEINFKQVSDHPLSRAKESPWNNYFEDHKLWSKIEKDTKRTRQREQFFSQVNNNKCYQENSGSLIAILGKDRANNEVEYNYDVLSRILFLYAKLNDGVYVQGMNEIVALMFFQTYFSNIFRYHCFATDESIYLKHQAEADTFYCFAIVMTELKQNFSKTQFNSLEDNEYLKERIRNFSELLKKVDAKLFEHFQKLHLDFKFFCIKWFISSLAQEFAIKDTLKLWDSIICQQNKNDFVLYLSISILMQMREDLIKGEFGEIMMKIQNLEQQNIDISKLLNNACLLQKEFKR